MPLIASLRNRALCQLASKAAMGDRTAFGKLYQKLLPEVFAFVRRRINKVADAEDVTSQVFAKMIEQLSTFDSNRGTIRAWVFTMVRNLIVDHYRSQGRRMTMSIEGELVDRPEDASQDARWKLQSLLKEISPEGQELLLMHYGDGLRFGEIAEILGISKDAAKQRCSRLVRQLRKDLDPSSSKQEPRYAS